MSPPVESRDIGNCRFFARAASALAVLAGNLVLLGWWIHVPALTGVLPGLATMRPNTALCFVLAGLSLWLIQLRPGELSNPRVRRIQAARVLSGVVGLVGLLTLVEYLFSVNLGIDEVLFHRSLQATGIVHPGRMSGATALGLLLLGASVQFITRHRPYLAQSFALVTSLTGFVACLGYLLDVRALYDVPAYSCMALPTAILLVVMGLAALVARPQLGLMAAVTSEYVGGVLARRVLPLTVVIPTFLAWLRWRGELAGFSSWEFGIALRTLAEVVAFATLLWTSAIWLNRVDEERRHAKRRSYDLAAIVESSHVAIISKDLSGAIVTWNQGAEQLYGYSAAEIIGKPVTTIIPPELQEDAAQFLKEVAEGRLATREETLRRRKDGSLVDVSLIVSPVRDLEGHIVGASIIAHDITERKRAEEALRGSEARLRLAQEVAKIGTFERHFQTGESRWTPEMEAMYGLPPAEFPRTIDAFLDLVHGEDRPYVAGLLEQSNQTGYAEGEWRVVWPDGTEHWIAGRWKVFQDEHGRPLRILGVDYDITDRKRAEKRLLEYERVVEGLEEMIIVVDRQYRYVIANRAFLNYRDMEREQVLGRLVPEVLNEPVFRTVVKEKLDQCFRGEVVTYEMRFKYPKLGERILSISYFPIEGPNGIDRVACVLHDITDRKRVEEALRESEARLNEAQHTAGIGSWRYVPDATFIWSDEMYELFKLPRDVPVTYDAIVSVVHPEDRAGSYNRAFERALASDGVDFQAEYRVVWPDGQVRTVFSLGKIHRDADGRVLEAVGTVQDVTERRQAEEALRLNEERLRLAVRTAAMGVFEWQLQSRVCTWTPEIFEIFGLPAGSPQPTLKDMVSLCHPEDRPLFEGQAVLLVAGEPIRFDCRIIRPGGEVRWVEISGQGMFDCAGQPVRYLGMCRDITERKQTEESLRAQSKQLRALMARLQQVREEERTSVARNLHDQIGQIMTAVKMEVAWVANHLPENQDKLQRRAKETLELITDGIHSVRKLCTELRPGVLDDLGLAAAIEWQAGEFASRSGIACELSLPPGNLELDNDRSTATFRIFQEALTNVARHAHATKVQATIRSTGDHLILTVSDNGIGIDSARSSGKTFGILGMKERAAVFGGTVEFVGAAGKGTTVKLVVPLQGGTQNVSSSHSAGR